MNLRISILNIHTAETKFPRERLPLRDIFIYTTLLHSVKLVEWYRISKRQMSH